MTDGTRAELHRIAALKEVAENRDRGEVELKLEECCLPYVVLDSPGRDYRQH